MYQLFVDSYQSRLVINEKASVWQANKVMASDTSSPSDSGDKQSIEDETSDNAGDLESELMAPSEIKQRRESTPVNLTPVKQSCKYT